MARPKARADRLPGAEGIRKAAIALFKARGYHGTPVRELAEALHIETASLYYHFPSKQAILTDLFDRIMDEQLEGLHRALASGSTPEEQLRAAVHFHALVHIERQDELFISHSELRSLSARNRSRIIAKRDRYEKMVRDLLIAGVRSGRFEIPDVRLTTIAILTMCSGISDWFVGRGRLSPSAIADRYSDMVLRLVSRPPGAPAQSRGQPRQRRSGNRERSRTDESREAAGVKR